MNKAAPVYTNFFVAQAFLDEWRRELRSILEHSALNISIESDRLLWWTFAGGQINHTLKYGIQVQRDWKIVADNFKLKIEGSGVTSHLLLQTISDLSTEDFWRDPSTRSFLSTNLPNYRLSKFQSALPVEYSLEIVEYYLLDISITLDYTKNQEYFLRSFIGDAHPTTGRKMFFSK